MTAHPRESVRKVEIERAREKATRAYDDLADMLDKDEHDEECVLRCVERRACGDFHDCRVCGDDE